MSKLPRSVWLEQLSRQIESEHEQFSRHNDYQFYDVNLWLRSAEIIDKQADNCHVCQAMKEEINSISANLAQYINETPKRKAYQKQLHKQLKHLKEAHAYRSKYYFTSLYSLLGILSGTAIGAIFLILTSCPVLQCLLIGAAIGLTAGRSWGAYKDRMIRQAEKVL